MTVGVLIVTHNGVGSALLETAKTTLGVCPLNTKILSVPDQCSPGDLVNEGQSYVDELDTGDGVLILTDMFGSTPSNIACALKSTTRLCIVSGLNLPMLIRTLNYPALDLEELATKALSGGREGIGDCQKLGYFN
ncbi:MAG: PTS sugar transporter subunit IIA [Gammaproteobacteria bacterium]|nr:PTS sugar transporter subunit IIA [Gammaproteobacteria bacterium]MDH5692600.1 PTS sugar transporter subunit IIA [Gammaproteobacteria bacterium]